MNNKIIGIVIVVAVMVGGIGFYGGMKYGENKATVAATAMRGQNRFGGAGMMGGRNGAGLSAGEVIAKDATSITVKLRNGGSQIVIFGGSTAVMKSVSGSVSDLAVGNQVTVTGTQNSDGSITAQSIQIRPALQ